MQNMKRNTIRKTGIILLAGVLSAILIISLFSTIWTVNSYGVSSISSLKSQLSDIEQKKKDLETEMESIEDDISNAMEKKEAIDGQIANTQAEIETTEAIIEEYDGQIAQKEVELTQAIADLDAQNELFAKRVRAMYENGETTYLDVLLSSEDFSEMLSNLEIISQIMEYDTNLVDKLTGMKEDVEAKKASLEADRADQVTYKESLDGKKAELDRQKEQSQAIIDELNSDLDLKKSEVEKLEAEKDDIAAEVQKLSQASASKGGSSYDASGASYVSSQFVWPAPGYTRITSPFGMRTHPVTGVYKLHTGTDVGAPSGATVQAAASGTVVKSCYTSAYGNYVVIDHGSGVMTAYAHMTARNVSVGDSVSAGQKVGSVGSTGYATGPHLHFEVIINGSFVNPMNYFS